MSNFAQRFTRAMSIKQALVWVTVVLLLPACASNPSTPDAADRSAATVESDSKAEAPAAPAEVAKRVPPEQPLPTATATERPTVLTETTKLEVAPPSLEVTEAAEITQPAPQPIPNNTPALAVAVEPAVADAPLEPLTLPKQYGPWRLSRGDEGRCLIRTGTIQIGNAAFATQVQMQIEAGRVLISGYQPIDTASGRTSIQFDDGDVLALSAGSKPSQAQIRQDLTQVFIDADSLNLRLMTEKSGQGLIDKRISLQGIAPAIVDLRRCAQG